MDGSKCFPFCRVCQSDYLFSAIESMQGKLVHFLESYTEYNEKMPILSSCFLEKRMNILCFNGEFLYNAH